VRKPKLTRHHHTVLRMIQERPKSFNPDYPPVKDLVDWGWAYWKRGAFGRTLLHMTHPQERPA
jgi:hypothetical protein